MNTVTVKPESKTITVAQSRINVLFGARQGPPGPPGPIGPPGDSIVVTADEGDVNIFQVVFMTNAGRAQAANANEVSHCGRVVGMLVERILEGWAMKTSGEVTNPAWSLTPGQPYFLGAGGEIVSSVAGLKFVQKIGVAKSATTLILDLGVPILV